MKIKWVKSANFNSFAQYEADFGHGVVAYIEEYEDNTRRSGHSFGVSINVHSEVEGRGFNCGRQWNLASLNAAKTWAEKNVEDEVLSFVGDARQHISDYLEELQDLEDAFR